MEAISTSRRRDGGPLSEEDENDIDLVQSDWLLKGGINSPSFIPQFWRNKQSANSGESGSRNIYFNSESGEDDQEQQRYQNFPSNKTTSTKYDWLTFWWKWPFEQFQRLSNFYFLLVILIEFIPGVAPFSPISSIIPLVFVLGVTAIKDLWDDVNRFRADREVNTRKVTLLIQKDSTIARGAREMYIKEQTEETSTSKHFDEYLIQYRDVKVGDILKIEDGEEFPADLIFLRSSEEGGTAMIETSNLDGETSKKTKTSVWPHLIGEQEDFHKISGTIVCENPTIILDQFNASFLCSTPENTIPLTSSQILLRGAQLVNTEYIIGIVAYTGRDTKLVLNQNSIPLKTSMVQKKLNYLLIILICFVLFICFLSSIGSFLWRTYGFFQGGKTGEDYWYLNMNSRTESIGTAAKSFLTFFVLMNVIVPISLFVTLEIVKFIQSKFIEYDLDMYDEDKDLPIKVNTTNLLEELGQVQYVFTDKTGTLTNNNLIFQKCSIKGVKLDKKSLIKENKNDPNASPNLEGSSGVSESLKYLLHEMEADDIREFFLCLAICHSVYVSHPRKDEVKRKPRRKKRSGSIIGRLPNWVRLINNEAEQEAGKGQDDEEHDDDDDEEYEIKTNDEERTDEERGDIIYQASSPDEETLVKAARSVGVRLIDRTADSVILDVWGSREEYKILAEVPFTSDRRRMSVVVKKRHKQGEAKQPIRVYTKGAEDVLFEKLKDTVQQERALSTTKNHIKEFAVEGLRTLVFATKTVKKEFSVRWLKHWKRSKGTQDNNEEENLADQIESEMELLGATGVEDSLQKGVERTLRDLSKAGIKMWMLTGDKMETARNIAYTAGLLLHENQMTVSTLSADSADELEIQLDAILETLSTSRRSSFIITSPLLQSASPSTKPSQTTLKTGIVIDGNTLQLGIDSVKNKLFSTLLKSDVVVCCRVSPKQKAQVVHYVKRKRPGKSTLAIGDGANDVSMIREADVGIGIIGKEGSQASRSSDYAISQFRYLRKLLFVHGRYAYIRITMLILYSFYKNVAFTLPQFYFGFYNGFSGQTLFNAWILVLFNLVFTNLTIGLYAIWDRDVPEYLLLKNPELYDRSRMNKIFTIKNLIYWLFLGVMHSFIVYFFGGIFIWGDELSHSGQTSGLWSFGSHMAASLIIVVTIKIMLITNLWTFYHYASYLGSSGMYFVFLAVYSRLNDDMRGVFWQEIITLLYWLGLLIVVVVCMLPDFIIQSARELFYPGDHIIVAERIKLKKRANKRLPYQARSYGSVSERKEDLVQRSHSSVPIDFKVEAVEEQEELGRSEGHYKMFGWVL